MATRSDIVENKDVALEYFRRLDLRDPSVLDLFTDDFTFYFPKYGLGRGRDQLLEVMAGLGTVVASTSHEPSDYRFLPSGDHLVVEGTTSGATLSGATWAAGKTPGGRFCNVFQFRDGRISRLAVYLDPDYAGENAAGFLWGRDGRAW